MTIPFEFEGLRNAFVAVFSQETPLEYERFPRLAAKHPSRRRPVLLAIAA